MPHLYHMTISNLPELGRHMTPASSLCWQLDCPQGLWAQAPSPASSPVHLTSSNHMLPVPSPKNAPVRGIAVILQKKIYLSYRQGIIVTKLKHNYILYQNKATIQL